MIYEAQEGKWCGREKSHNRAFSSAYAENTPHLAPLISLKSRRCAPHLLAVVEA